MKAASSCRADDVNVRLCFLVNVRKASGRRVAGGRRIGSIVVFVVGAIANGLCVYAGVPKAGDDDGIRSLAGAGVLGANKPATSGRSPGIMEVGRAVSSR